MTWVDREYVYGPDYVDEFILQIDRKGRRTMYMLQDANYNVVALTACEGHPGGQGGTLADGAMLEQYTYEPYGEIAATESFASHAVNRVGHQGLFFEVTSSQPRSGCRLHRSLPIVALLSGKRS